MSIKQFSAAYLASDDRLLFRFNTNENTEFRFWFKRRVTLFILAATQHLIVRSLEQDHTSQAAQAIAQFNKDAVELNPSAHGVSLTTPYIPAENYPLGADPILIMDVKCTFEKDGSEEVLSLDLILPGGANINLKMAGPTLQAMLGLLNQLRQHAAWGEVPALSQQSFANEDDDQHKNTPLVH